MGRLIDADELLTQIRQIDFLKIPNSTKLSACEIMEIVNNQPTAYNMDKVVAELEDLEEDFCQCFRKCEEQCFIQRVTDIVRKGGVE